MHCEQRTTRAASVAVLPLAGVRALTIHRDLDLQRGGGVPRGVLKRVRVLKELGADVEVWGLKGGVGMAEALAKAGIPSRVLAVSGKTLALGTALKIRRMLVEYQLDVVQTHLYHASVHTCLAKILGAPGCLIITMHSPPPKPTRRLVLRMLKGVPDRIVFVSPITADQWVRALRLQREKIFIFPNAVDTEQFRPDLPAGDVKAELKLEGYSPIILCVARVDFHHKAQDKLLEVFEQRVAPQLPEAALVFAGGGPNLDELRRAAGNSSVSSRIRVLGVRHDVHKLMAAADIFVLPSYYESDPQRHKGGSGRRLGNRLHGYRRPTSLYEA